MKVSVVVPVWNPGPFIDDCIRTLTEQSMSPDEYEVIFVDDGSTDGSGERLEALATQNRAFRVIRQPNSGWPGKPRNVGTDAARGEYVLFMDQDDALGLEALERMYELGKANDSDIVIGKVVSDFRGVPHNVFRHTVPACDYRTGPLIDSLTPHKMFRRSFLQEHRIRYPEGPRRLEDQHFMVQAYLAAKRTSIVGDYLCYRYQRRADGKNAGSATFNPAAYYGNLREILDVVDAHVPPGDVRDRLYRRFYGTELMNRVSGAAFLDDDDDHRRSLVAAVATLLGERFPRSLDAGMPAATRVRGALARRGDVEELVELARRIREVKAASRLRALRWDGRQYVADVEAWMLQDGEPLTLERSGGRLLLPRSLVGERVSDDDRDLTDQVGDILADVVVTERGGLAEWFARPPLRASVEPGGETGARVVLRGEVPLDPGSLAGGRPLEPSVQDVHVRIQFLGIKRTARLGADRDTDAVDRLLPVVYAPTASAPTASAQAALRMTPYWTRHDNLSLRVERSALPRATVQSARIDDHARMSVSIPLRAEAGAHTLTLRLTQRSRVVDVPLAGQSHGDLWTAELPRLRVGAWAAQLVPVRGSDPALDAGAFWVGPTGRARWVPDRLRPRRPLGRAVRRARRVIGKR